MQNPSPFADRSLVVKIIGRFLRWRLIPEDPRLTRSALADKMWFRYRSRCSLGQNGHPPEILANLHEVRLYPLGNHPPSTIEAIIRMPWSLGLISYRISQSHSIS
jgi:hypothetical protein